jgi:polar amino acid transport system substrate-binding protein
MKRNIVIAVILIIFLNIFLVTVYYSLTSNINIIDHLLKRNRITKEEKLWLDKKGVLIYGSDRSSPPLRYVDSESGQYIGLVVDYVNALSIELGIEIKLEPLIWSYALKKLKNGETDFSDMFPSKERGENFLFSNSIYNLRGIIVTASDNSEINDTTDLKDKIVAVPDGDFAMSFLKARNPDQKLLLTSDNFTALEKVRDGFADAVVGDEPVLSYYINKMGDNEKFKILSDPAYEQECVLAVPKSERMLVNIINKGIYNLKTKGMMLKIQQKWLGVTASFVQTDKVGEILILLLFFFTIMVLALYIYSQLNKTLKREIARRTEELLLSRNELQTTFDGLAHLMVTYNESCEIVNVNKSFSNFLGYDAEDILHNQCLSFGKIFFENCSNCIVKKTFKHNKIFKKELSVKSGIYQLSSYPIELHKSEMQKVLLMDITTEKITEIKYFHNNKMAAIGQLAAGMAHEIRNPLGLIRNYSYLLKRDSDFNNPRISKSINQIEVSVEKASSIIDNLLNFSRLDNNNTEKILIRDFIDEILQLEKKVMHRKRISYELKCSDDVSYCINREVLKHIVINLIGNAVDAMSDDGGQFFIDVEKSDDQVTLVFKDTGTGIFEKDIENIFNPFFTTKKRGRGTGLGLYIVYNDVRQYGGEISVKSAPGKGSAFTVTLPFTNGANDESL